VTAGLSFADLSTDIVGVPFGTQSKINLSWTAGVGVEYLLADRWSAKLEYLYMNHSGISCATACGVGPISFNLNENVVRLGLNYRLWDR